MTLVLVILMLLALLRSSSALVLRRPAVARAFSSLAAAAKEDEPFRVTAPYEPTGDQPQAIQQLLQQLEEGDRCSILRGITGTGKTLVMSHVIAARQQPTLVLCHNKTLAAQLARELRGFLRESAVELFVSYYNSYVPESFNEATGKYNAKKTSINPAIDILRHRATRALLTRRDVVVVASVSCIYGLGMPKEYLDASWSVHVGQVLSWEKDVLEQLVEHMWYRENGEDESFERGQFQLIGHSGVTIWPPDEQYPMTILFQPMPEGMVRVKSIRQGTQGGTKEISTRRLFPARHHVSSHDKMVTACETIEAELREQVAWLKDREKLNEAQLLEKRVRNDLMMIQETGFCKGIENYSRHFDGRAPGETPSTLIDYMDDDWLLMIDESHVTLPQIKAMYYGDRARKESLIKHGYRLPSALDNRPLQDEEFWRKIRQAVFVSATPSAHEIGWSERPPVDMIIRPTFVCDPEIIVRDPGNQLEDLRREIRERAARQQRTLVITLTKRDAEDLSHFLEEEGIPSAYIHSGLKTTERSDAIKKVQEGEVDCLVGINCLREGLDLPQVSLVAVLGADCEGFLRSETALLQIVGRAARHVDGKAIFYARSVTESMRRCIDATQDRRQKQLGYVEKHGLEMRTTTGSTVMSIFDLMKDEIDAQQELEKITASSGPKGPTYKSSSLSVGEGRIETDHVPSSPGVYFWKDENGKVLYIGKAKNLRSRIRSYLAPKAKHGNRIDVMLSKAASVDIILTPSERDALVLESNLIKHHQPAFNVLMKDDEHYPYICASVGDRFPRFSVVPRKHEGASDKYRYFGPYTSFAEINRIMDEIESRYDLRGESFKARHGEGSQEDYVRLFERALVEVFDGRAALDEDSIQSLRAEYEEANKLFESKYNACRDVVCVAPIVGDDSSVAIQVVQLRDGLVAGKFTYSAEIPYGVSTPDDLASVTQTVLERRHYPAGENSDAQRFSWFPDEILMESEPIDASQLKQVISVARRSVESERRAKVRITLPAKKGQRKEVDERVMDFARKNVQQFAYEMMLKSDDRAAVTSLDGTAAKELATLLSLDKHPSRIECYDISHTHGEFAVGSRVVFIDGKPAPHLYRRFHIRTVEGIDDYASLAEVLERRFRRSHNNGESVDAEDPWSLPDLVVIDGGPGQLGAAVKGLANAGVEARGVDCNEGVPICSLAKNEEEVFVYGQPRPVNDRPDSPALLLLRALRDESHRFALSKFPWFERSFHSMIDLTPPGRCSSPTSLDHLMPNQGNAIDICLGFKVHGFHCGHLNAILVHNEAYLALTKDQVVGLTADGSPSFDATM